MLSFRKRYIKWIKKHPISSFICGIYLFSSFLLISFLNFDRNSIILKFVELFATKNLDKIAITVIFIILMSGIEVSLGFLMYSIWMIWSFIFLFLGRIFIHYRLNNYQILFLELSGPSCAVFCPFLTFIFIHQPIYYFKIKKYRFTDTLFYTIGMFQYIFLIDPLNTCVDFIICSFSNLIFHLIYTLLKRTLFQNHRNLFPM